MVGERDRDDNAEGPDVLSSNRNRAFYPTIGKGHFMESENRFHWTQKTMICSGERYQINLAHMETMKRADFKLFTI